MPDAIRLVCPECDAVHRVKEITLGKLYRCKKCKSGLITMTPAVLACPSCGATTPPSHIEVSRLITCQECEDAPLMSVRFANAGRHETRLGRDSTRSLAQDRSREARAFLAEESEPTASATSEAEAPAEESASSTQPEAATEAVVMPPAAAVAQPSAPTRTAAPSTPAGTERGGESTAPAVATPAPEFQSAPVASAPVRNTDSARIRPETPPVASSPASAPAAPRSAAPATSDAAVERTAIAPTAPEAALVTATPAPRPAAASLPPAQPRPTSRRINDTAFITRRSEELLQHAEQTLAESFKEETRSPAAPTRPAMTASSTAEDESYPAEPDSVFEAPAAKEPEPARTTAASTRSYASPAPSAPESADARQLRQLLLELQQPFLRELERSRLSVPVWIPIAFALLLFGLFGWLVGALDGVKDDLTSARREAESKDKAMIEQRAQLDSERTRMAMENQRLIQLIPQLQQVQEEKRRLEHDLEDLLHKYDALEQQQQQQKKKLAGFSGFSGPELGPNE